MPPEPRVDAPPGEAGAPAPSTRGLVRKVVWATVLGGLVFAALSFYGDVRAVGGHLRSFRVEAFAGALALATGNYALRIVRWQYYLRRLDIRLRWRESAPVFLAGFVMTVTPGKLGEAFKALLLRDHHGVPIPRTVSVVVAERLTDLVSLVVLIAIGALAFAEGVPIAIASAAVVGTGLFACAYRPFGLGLIALVGRLPGGGRIAPRLRQAYDALSALVRPAPLLIGSALATLAWALEALGLHLVLLGFDGAAPEWTASFFAYCAATMAGALAMMPGGLGVTELGMTGLLVTLGGPGIDAAVATGATILIRIATLWWAVAVGLVALLTLGRAGRSQ